MRLFVWTWAPWDKEPLFLLPHLPIYDLETVYLRRGLQLGSEPCSTCIIICRLSCWWLTQPLQMSPFLPIYPHIFGNTTLWSSLHCPSLWYLSTDLSYKTSGQRRAPHPDGDDDLTLTSLTCKVVLKVARWPTSKHAGTAFVCLFACTLNDSQS